MLPTEIILIVALNHIRLLSFIEVPDYSCAHLSWHQMRTSVPSKHHLCPFTLALHCEP